MSFTGYDIEDAIILNQGSIDRGFGRVMKIKRVGVELDVYPNGNSDTIDRPSKEDRRRKDKVGFNKFSKLGDDGIVNVGKILTSGDIYVNKSEPVDKESVDRIDNWRNPRPSYFNENLPVNVDRVILSSTPDIPFKIKMITR